MTDTVTTEFETTFAGVFRVESDPHPYLSYTHAAARPDGLTKQIRGGAEVRDEAELARVERELRPGDRVEIEVSTDWDDPRIRARLVNFRKLEGPAPSCPPVNSRANNE